MGDKDKPEDKKPDGDLLLTLQNRLNSLEIKLSEAEKAEKPWAQRKDLEDQIKALEARIADKYAEKPKPVPETKPEVKPLETPKKKPLKDANALEILTGDYE